MMRHIEHGMAGRAAAAVIAAFIVAVPARAQTQLSAELAPLTFLVGDWIGENGHAEGGMTARGTSSIQPVTDGRALLRRDHTTLLNAGGQIVQSFDQIMMIYPEHGHLHGDYFDGTHAIHYLDAVTAPRGTVTFVTADTADTPGFRLTYTPMAPGKIGIRFEMRAPGTSAFTLIASGTAHRAQ